MISNYNSDKAKKPTCPKTLATQASNFERVSDPVKVEWAQIAPNKVIVATEERTWLSRPRAGKAGFAKPMEEAGSVATTQKLLDGAIAAAKYAVNSDVRPPALTATRWVWRLAGAYHLTSPVVGLMKEAAKSFAANNRQILAEWASEKIEEEQGHDLLALKDIQSLGYDAQAVVQKLVPPAAVALMDYFTRSAQAEDPIDTVGYAYTLERLSLGIGEEYIQKVENLLPPRTNATRCLRVHSSVGADANHVEENALMIAQLSSAERCRIARACYETALMCFSPPIEGYISKEELQQILEPLKINDMSADKS